MSTFFWFFFIALALLISLFKPIISFSFRTYYVFIYRGTFYSFLFLTHDFFLPIGRSIHSHFLGMFSFFNHGVHLFFIPSFYINGDYFFLFTYVLFLSSSMAIFSFIIIPDILFFSSSMTVISFSFPCYYFFLCQRR